MYQDLYIPSPVDRHLGGFQFGAIMSKATIKILVQAFLWVCFHFSWVGGAWQDQRVDVCLTLEGTAKHYSKVVTTFSFPLTEYECSGGSTSWTQSLIAAILVDVK